ncbi:MAG TPA: hypothetical protein VGG29_17550 [Caulobacteraceae bacterium]
MRAFLKQVRRLQGSEFPQEEGREALAQLETHFETLHNEGQLLPDTAAESLIQEWVDKIDQSMPAYTNILGFILRSTNTRNAFEVYYPIKRLIHLVLGEQYHLMLSSEWDFIPFVWPLNLEFLPEFVLVGLPAPESGNVLLIPLSAHEVGHSAWVRHDLESKVGPTIDGLVNAVLQPLDPVSADIQSYIATVAKVQAQEVFCDLFAIKIFRESYVFAFAYFMSSCRTERDPVDPALYPSIPDRFSYIMQAGGALGLTIPPELLAEFSTRQIVVSDGEGEGMETKAVDAAVAMAVPELQRIAFEVVEDANVPVVRKSFVKNVLRALRSGEPYGGSAFLSEIVIAGWYALMEEGGLSSDGDQKKYDLLMEILLKTVEVSEYVRRVDAS